MFSWDGRWLAFVAFVGVMYPADAFSGLMYRFENGGVLDGATRGRAAPFPGPDGASGSFGTMTTHAVTNADGSAGARLNENAGSLGVNSVGSADDAGDFERQESWTFSWDVDTTFDFIDFDALSGSENMAVQSAAWQGKAYTIETGRNLAFESSSGQFTFGNDGLDAFDLRGIVTGNSLLVSADTPYRFSFAGGGRAAIGQLDFSSPAAVAPEPSSAIVLLGLAGAATVGQWRRKRKRRQDR